MLVAVDGRVAFPSAEVRYVEREGTTDLIYVGLVPRGLAASLAVTSGTDTVLSYVLCITKGAFLQN